MKDHHEVACHLFDIGRFDLAERELCSELKENPQRHSSMAMLAVARSNLDRTDEALESANAALAGDPQNPYCHYAHAIVLWKADRWRKAMDAMAEAQRLAPDDPDYPATLADYHAGFDEYGEAIRLCEDALRLDPNHLSALCTMAYSFVEMNRWSQARGTALQALEINADDAYAHAISGWANLGLKNHTQALDHFLQALRKIPSYQWAQEGLIEALQCHNWLYRFLVVTCFGKFRSRKAGAEPRTRSGQQSKEDHLPIWAVVLIVVWSLWAMTRFFVLEEAARDSKGMTSLDVGLFFLTVELGIFLANASRVFMFLLQFDRWAAPILKFDQKFYANVSVGVLAALPIAVLSGMILNAKLAWIICSVMLICIVPFATAAALPEGALRRGVMISAGVMLAAAIGWYLYGWFGVRGSSEIAVMRFVLHSLILSVIVSIPFAVLAKWKVGEARAEE